MEASSIGETADVVIPRIRYEEDSDPEPTSVSQNASSPAHVDPRRIVFDEDAEEDEPTHTKPLIVTSGCARTDPGRRRSQNEDSFLLLDHHALYVVADGMGGYAGGSVASAVAVDTLAQAFEEGLFDGMPHHDIPSRASELARAIQMANQAIHHRALGQPNLHGMGTTMCAARFSPKKQRLYVGHVGDSRVYRLRDDAFVQMTSDHTMEELGVKGREGKLLSRAVGIWPSVPVDMVFAKPVAGDVYLLCSDGLTKVVTDEEIATVLGEEKRPHAAAMRLVDMANENGGPDNVTVIVVRVTAPGTVWQPARKVA